jgi:hypothetical protein
VVQAQPAFRRTTIIDGEGGVDCVLPVSATEVLLVGSVPTESCSRKSASPPRPS